MSAPLYPSHPNHTEASQPPSAPTDFVMFPVPTSIHPSNEPAATNRDILRLTSLPDELIAMCYADLPASDLVALEHVSHRLRTLIAEDGLCWRRCVQTRWAHLTANAALSPSAARHAGSWKALYSEKALCDATHNPWLVLCRSEIRAVLDVIKGDAHSLTPTPWGDSARVVAANGGDEEDEDSDGSLRDNAVSAVVPAASTPVVSAALPASPPACSVRAPTGGGFTSGSPVSVVTGPNMVPTLSIVLLFDASSSVTDEDFGCMKRFALNLVDNLRFSVPEAVVGVVQFNQHPRVEVPLTNVCKSKLSTSIDNMDQLMGSTDIAAPIRRARQILAEEAAPGDRVIVLLTDGQTHADELCESEKEARKAFEEVQARLYTLGVGRDIDEIGLGRVAAGSETGKHFTLRRLVSSK